MNKVSKNIMLVTSSTLFDKWYLHNFKCLMQDNGTAIYISNKNRKTKKSKKKRR